MPHPAIQESVYWHLKDDWIRMVEMMTPETNIVTAFTLLMFIAVGSRRSSPLTYILLTCLCKEMTLRYFYIHIITRAETVLSCHFTLYYLWLFMWHSSITANAYLSNTNETILLIITYMKLFLRYRPPNCPWSSGTVPDFRGCPSVPGGLPHVLEILGTRPDSPDKHCFLTLRASSECACS